MKQELFQNAIDIILAEPIFTHLRHEDYLTSVFLGLGKRLAPISYSAREPFQSFDVFLKENNQIYTIIDIEYHSSTDTTPWFLTSNDRFESLRGEWDIFYLPDKSRYEDAIPAIVLEYLRLRENGKFEDDLDKMLNVYAWRVGFH